MPAGPITFTVQALRDPRPGLRVAAYDLEGRRGVGEGFPLPSRTSEDPDEAIATLKSVMSRGLTPTHDTFSTSTLEAAGRVLGTCAGAGAGRETTGAPAFPVATFALESALLNLAAAQESLPADRLLRRLFEAKGETPRPAPRLPVNVLLPDLPLPALIAAAKAALAAGRDALKLKIGRAPFAEDLARLRALRDALGPEAILRADANGAWTLAEAQAHLDALAPLALEYVEQPVPAEDLPELPASPVPVAADESLAREATVARLEETRRAAVWVLKPGALGLARCVALSLRAHAAGTDLVVTHAADGPVAGRVASAFAKALATTSPHTLRACGVAPA